VRKVLDIGCATGSLGASLKQRGNITVVGIEVNGAMAEVAAERLDRVIVGDIEKIQLEEHFRPNQFDCIIFADVLEHLVDPWTVLHKAVPFLETGGIVVASIPNIRHFQTFLTLYVKGHWPYREYGIHDRTHLRFFTLRTIHELFSQAGLEITQVVRKYRLTERSHPSNRFSKYFSLYLFRNLFTYQYLIIAKRSQAHSGGTCSC
jgi:methionine biosynthesis protein MetW